MEQRTKFSPAVLLPVLLSFIVVLTGVLIICKFQSVQIFDKLPITSVLSLNAAVALISLGILLEWGNVGKFWRETTHTTQFGLGILLVTTMFVLIYWVPKTNRIIFDEHIYEGIGVNISEVGKAFLCVEGQIREGEYLCPVTEFNKEPNGFPFYLAMFFRVFGPHERSAHWANISAHLFGGVLIFLLIFLFAKSEVAALFGSAFFLFNPESLIWAHTAAVEPSTIAFSIAAVCSALLFSLNRSWGALFLFCGFLSMAVQFRMESLLLFFPIGILLFWHHSQRAFDWQKILWAVVILCLLLLSHAVHIWVVKEQNWGSEGPKFAWMHFLPNLKVNGSYFLNNHRFPVVIFLLALSSWPLIFFKRTAGLFSLNGPLSIFWSWAFVFWIIFLFFYAGSYEYGADSRFALLVVPPLSILAGLGASQLCQVLISKRSFGNPILPLIGVLLLAWTKFIPLIKRVGIEAWDSRASILFIRESAPQLPKNSMVFSNVPSVWLMQGQSASQVSFISQNPNHLMDNTLKQFPGGAYFHWDYWCDVDRPQLNSECIKIKTSYDMKLVHTKNFHERTFELYRIFPKNPVAPEQVSQKVVDRKDEDTGKP